MIFGYPWVDWVLPGTVALVYGIVGVRWCYRKLMERSIV